jgi:hypothetical protein
MSRQFRFFLLPSDAESLIADLRDRVGLKLIDAKSHGPQPVEIESPIHKVPTSQEGNAGFSTYCYLVAAVGADVKTRYIAEQGYWLVQEELSEVIEFSGFEYDDEVLLAGRFYFHTDFLLGNDIWPKRDRFLKWADRVFRRAKRTIPYSKALDAYVGNDAEARKLKGGRFAWMRVRDQEPQWADEPK